MPLQVTAAQQYNTAGAGYGPLHKWVTQHTRELHQPPAGQKCVVTSGSNQAIDVRCSPARAPPCAAGVWQHLCTCLHHHVQLTVTACLSSITSCQRPCGTDLNFAAGTESSALARDLCVHELHTQLHVESSHQHASELQPKCTMMCCTFSLQMVLCVLLNRGDSLMCDEVSCFVAQLTTSVWSHQGNSCHEPMGLAAGQSVPSSISELLVQSFSALNMPRCQTRLRRTQCLRLRC